MREVLSIIGKESFYKRRDKYAKEYLVISFACGLFEDQFDKIKSVQGFDIQILNQLTKPDFYESDPLNYKEKIGLFYTYAEKKENIFQLEKIICITNEAILIKDESISQSDTNDKEYYIVYMKKLPSNDHNEVKIIKIFLEVFEKFLDIFSTPEPPEENKKLKFKGETNIAGMNTNNLILVNKKDREKKSIEELSGNFFTNSYISFRDINEILREVDMTLAIVGHESSGRSSFIQTSLNYLEGRDENNFVYEKYLQCYEEKGVFYRFGIDSQANNEYIIVNTKRFGGKRVLLVETPHFSEFINPSFDEIVVVQEIDKLFVSNDQIVTLVTKKCDERYMNSNMEKCLTNIIERHLNHEIHYAFTFYASSFVFKPTLKSSQTMILKINNNINMKKKMKKEQWEKLHKKVHKLFTVLSEKNIQNPDFPEKKFIYPRLDPIINVIAFTLSVFCTIHFILKKTNFKNNSLDFIKNLVSLSYFRKYKQA